jgi:hypothetical protein
MCSLPFFYVGSVKAIADQFCHPFTKLRQILAIGAGGSPCRYGGELTTASDSASAMQSVAHWLV